MTVPELAEDHPLPCTFSRSFVSAVGQWSRSPKDDQTIRAGEDFHVVLGRFADRWIYSWYFTFAKMLHTTVCSEMKPFTLTELQRDAVRPHSNRLSCLCERLLLLCFECGRPSKMVVHGISRIFRQPINLELSSPVLATRLVKLMGSVRCDLDYTNCLAPVLRRSSRNNQSNGHSNNSRIDYEMATTTGIQIAFQSTAFASTAAS